MANWVEDRELLDNMVVSALTFGMVPAAAVFQAARRLFAPFATELEVSQNGELLILNRLVEEGRAIRTANYIHPVKFGRPPLGNLMSRRNDRQFAGNVGNRYNIDYYKSKPTCPRSRP